MEGSWRFLLDLCPRDGYWNMGLDEALLDTAARKGIATLRFYRWDGPWVSLGYRQAITWPKEESVPWNWVRRTTGGSAVLHGNDLTYSIAAPLKRLPGDRLATYTLVSQALLRAFTELGVVANLAGQGGRPDRSFDCFATAQSCEIQVEGKKLIGSAQRIRNGALLQHGSIRLAADLPELCQRTGLGKGATDLFSCGVTLASSELALHLKHHIATQLKLLLRADEATPEEQTRALLRGLAP